jgi:hypothetical protein
MAIADYIQGSGAAAIAYRNALNQSKDTTNQLFRSYGFTMPGEGGYSVNSAQEAFNPNKLFDVNTGGLDMGRVKEMAGTLSYGGRGALADIARGGGGAEAETLMGLRQAGIAKGGLAAQRRSLVEAQTGRQMTGAKEQFLAGLAGAYAPLGTAYQDVQAEMIADTADTIGSEVQGEVTPDYSLPDETMMDEGVAAEGAGVPAARPTVKDIRSKPAGSKLSTGAAGEFNTLLKSNRGNLANLKGMLKKWDLSPAQRTAVQRQINAANKARTANAVKPVAKPVARRAAARRPRPAPKPAPKPKPKRKKR